MSETSSNLTTYSEQERYEESKKQTKIQEEMGNEEIKEQRVMTFKRLEIYARNMDHPEIEFIEFTSKKIKFYIYPSKVNDFISKKLRFYIYMSYDEKYKRWWLKRYQLPMGCHKQACFNLFVKKKHEDYATDNYILDIINTIHDIFENWAEEEHDYRVNKMRRYRNGELDYLYLNSDDEELFLEEEEIAANFAKKQAILRRMIPPKDRNKI